MFLLISLGEIFNAEAEHSAFTSDVDDEELPQEVLTQTGISTSLKNAVATRWGSIFFMLKEFEGNIGKLSLAFHIIK